MNVIIVGGGIFGSIAAKVCSDAGHLVTVIDAKFPGAGHKAAGCVIRPSWVKSLGPDAEDALQLLSDSYGLHTVQFIDRKDGRPDKVAEGYWISPKEILCTKYLEGVVTKVENGKVTFLLEGKEEVLSGRVLVAAGVWANKLNLDIPEIRALCGQSCIFRGQHEPISYEYAPYKQSICFPREFGVTWFGDGTAILRKNYTDHFHGERTVSRARDLGIDSDLLEENFGMRPYVKSEGIGYFKRVFQNTWVSSGGAKNGSLLGALQAKKFLEEIG